MALKQESNQAEIAADSQSTQGLERLEAEKQLSKAVANLNDAVEEADKNTAPIVEEVKQPEKKLYYRKHFGDIYK